MNHAEARKYCQDNSSHLVEVQNQHQLDFIRIRAINEHSGVPIRALSLLKPLALLRIYQDTSDTMHLVFKHGMRYEST